MFKHIGSSKTIAGYDYNPTQQTLEVHYLRSSESPSVYRYLGVSERVYEQLEKATSKGTFVSQHIQHLSHVELPMQGAYGPAFQRRK